MPETGISDRLQERVAQAFRAQQPLCIRGSGSKDFYGREPRGDVLDVSEHSGIVHYEPTELAITARAGTPVAELEQALAEYGQILPFEPPRFGASATLGGTIACNLSGPRRPYAGAARDLVLGTRVLNGKGEILAFGGEVMKNVAGYDVSRLMCGAMGTLGVLLEVSLKVLPKPQAELTIRIQATMAEALQRLHEWGQKPHPVSASCFDGQALTVRLSGEESAVRAAHGHLGGEIQPEGEVFWRNLREHQLGFFAADLPLWRLSVASDAPPMDIDGDWLYEWGGAQRWLLSSAPAAVIRDSALRAGGHATRFRNGDRDQVFQPLAPGLEQLHRRLKQAFDSAGILNPGRMYADL